MNVQLIIVIICVIAAIGFIIKKFARAMRSGTCASCHKDCKNRTCSGGGECSGTKLLVELKPEKTSQDNKN